MERMSERPTPVLLTGGSAHTHHAMPGENRDVFVKISFKWKKKKCFPSTYTSIAWSCRYFNSHRTKAKKKKETKNKKHVARCRHPLPYIHTSIPQRSRRTYVNALARRRLVRRPRLFPSVLQKSINKQQKSRLWLLSYFDPFAALLWKEKKISKLLLGVRTHTAARELVSIDDSVASRARRWLLSLHAPHQHYWSFSGSEKKKTTTATIEWCVEYAILRSLFLACLLNARTTITSENCHRLHVPTHTYLLVLCCFFDRIPLWRRFDGRTDTCIACKHSEVSFDVCHFVAAMASTGAHKCRRERLRSSREQQPTNWPMCASSTARRRGECERVWLVHIVPYLNHYYLYEIM